MRQSAQSISPLPDEPAPREAPSQEIEYAPAVMEAIRAEAVAGLMRLGRGGIEVGGVLFGRNTSDAIRILAARPLECEHRFGPSFVMSEKDEDVLRQLLDPQRRDEETRDLEPLGWYVSHCRRTFALEENDIRIFDRYFPKPGSLTLIVMPEKIKPTRACFFVRDPNATMRLDVPSCEVLLPSPVDLALAGPAAALPPAAPPPPTSPPALPRTLEPLPPPQTALAPVNGAALDHSDVAARRLQRFLAQQEKHRRVSTWNLWATIIVLLLCTAGAGYLWIRSNNPEGPPAIPLHVSDSGDQIRIDWDAKLRSVQTANSGVLEMREADGTAEEIKLPPDALRTGSAYYTRRTDKVEIRLKLVYADKPAYESVVYFIHPLSSPVAQRTPLGPIAQTPPAQPLTPQPLTPPEPKVSPDGKVAEIKPVQPRVFQPPVMSRPAPATPTTVSSTPLPSPETLPSTRPPQLNLPLSAGPVIAPPPPAPVAPPARTEPARPRSGRLIWTGELGRNALLSISPAGASLGWVNGRLPGFPVHVSVHIAQLVEGGIEVYTEDSKAPKPAEPPSAQNGWNIVVYKPDTKRVAADLRVVEAPSTANSWNQMVVQNGKRAVSVLVIDWERAQ